MLLGSLVFDGTTGAIEDKVIGGMGWKHGEGTFDLMYFINLYSLPLLLAGMVASGEMGPFFSMGWVRMLLLLVVVLLVVVVVLLLLMLFLWLMSLLFF